MRRRLGVLLLCAMVGGPAAAWAQEKEKPAFDSLTVSIQSTWAWNRTLIIKGDGTYSFQMQVLEKVPGEKRMRPANQPYTAEYRLSAGHLHELTRLLAGTRWLGAPARNVPVIDGTTYALTLSRGDKEVRVTCQEVRGERTYAGLVLFLRRLSRQEELLFATTERGEDSPFAGQLLEELTGHPYAPALDYHRLVPAYEKFVRNPSLSPKQAMAAVKLMGYLKLESQRANIETLAQGHTPIKSDYKVPIDLRIAAVDALGAMDARRSLEVLEQVGLDNPALGGRAARAIMNVSDRRVIGMLARLASTNREAAWCLVQKGREAEPAIIEILRQPGNEEKGNRAAYHVIRAWFEHWNKRPPAPAPSPAVLSAIHDKVRSVYGGSLTGRYGIDLLRLAEDPFVVRDPRAEVEAFLALLADPKQGDRRALLEPMHFREKPAPEGFLHAAEQGLLSVKEVYIQDGWAWAHLSDEKGETHYGLVTDRNGGAWAIRSGRKLADEVAVRRDLDSFMRSFPKAVELVPGADADEGDLQARNQDAVAGVIRRLMTAVHDQEMETLTRVSIGSVAGWVSAEEAKELAVEVPAGWSHDRLKAAVEFCDKTYTRRRQLMSDFQALRVTDQWAAAHMTGPAGKDGPPGLLVLLQRTAAGWRLVDIAEPGAGRHLEEDMARHIALLAAFRNKLSVHRAERAKDAAARQGR